jgi:hypothetical protein
MLMVHVWMLLLRLEVLAMNVYIVMMWLAVLVVLVVLGVRVVLMLVV